MKFGNPPMLIITLVTVLFLSLFLAWTWRKRQRDIMLFVRSRLLAQLTVGVSKTRQKFRLLLLVVATSLLLLSLAHPQWGFTLEEVKQGGLDIVVAIDTSRSMLARDLLPNRLTRAKLAALEMIRLAKTDRLGLVAFAGTAFLQCPLTLDEEAYRQSLNAVEFGIVPQGGTEISSALQAALDAFKNDEDREKVVLLMTDGENHEYAAVSLAEKAAKNGIRIFTIGIGTPKGELVPQGEARSNSGFFKDEEGNVVQSHLNDSLLREIATAGRGFYLPLQGANTMDTLYQQGLAPLLGDLKPLSAKSNNAPRLTRRYHERFQWPLGLALLLLLLDMLLPERRIARRPDAAPHAGTGLSPVALALAILLAFPIANQGSPAKAQQLFETRKYEEAWKEYENLYVHHPKDTRYSYNAGVAAYEGKLYEKAVDSFNDALTSPDLKLQQNAFYNLGNTLYRLGEKAGDPKTTTQLWEQSAKSYEGSLKLNPKDADTQYNLQFVKKQLEELKKQQQQQPDQSQSSPDDQKDKKDQDKKNQDKKGQDKKDQPPQPEKQDSSPTNSPSQNPPKDRQNQANKSDAKKNEPDKPPTPSQEPAPKKPGKNENGADQAQNPDRADGQTNQPAAPPIEGQMTPQQVHQLLEAQKGEERIYIPRFKTNAVSRGFKDW